MVMTPSGITESDGGPRLVGFDRRGIGPLSSTAILRTGSKAAFLTPHLAIAGRAGASI
ncbi:MAG: hypothetical protein AVDCRST_MAG90-2903 [uncultured Microvirga sp.]|uniref:Uncharacterized protein n=1 Tax=uncultured Microvirga sp. TaxID=412392 RepID=A0A6J4MH24_9HYPH|nr:MAG: hypothetical protein AVDCRST_MAG90-2903 [uncultured Microvirga sp.]